MAEELNFNLKTRKLHFVFFFFSLFLFLSCFRWQITKASEFEEIAKSRTYTSELNSLRGAIYAKDGTTLAYSEPRFDMFVWMGDLEFFETRNVQTREEFISKVSEVIKMKPEELRQKLEENQKAGLKWFKIAESLKPEDWEKLRNLRTDKNVNRPLQGFLFNYTSERVYPEGRLATHVIGLTNKEKDIISGVGGIEESWNGDLSARKGFIIKENDAIGQAVATALIPTIEPASGSEIYTSIDKKLQYTVEVKTREFAERFKSPYATTIIMDPKTGEIMAMANYPDYDPNTRTETNQAVYTNRALSVPYEMGSIGKIFTLAVGLEAKAFERSTVILPEGHRGCEFLTEGLGDLCTWDSKPMPPMPVEECFTRSDNICLFHMLKMIGEKENGYDTFYSYLKKFGVGVNTSVDLAGESNGFSLDPSRWTIGEEAAYSFGHGYSVNALQAISAVSVIPNKGYRMQPHVVTKVVKSDGKEVIMKPQVLNNGEKLFSDATLAEVEAIMRNTYLNDIKDYETWYQHLKNYNIGMKSGTAVIANQYGYTDEVNNTQVGFDLGPDRKFIMLVHLERPEGGHLSFYNSRIMWLETFDAVKDYIGMQPIN